MARKPTIYPEIIKPGTWEVDEWTPDALDVGLPPCTDLLNQRMLVPFGHSPFAKEVRFHELLHVRYSPTGPFDGYGVTIPSLLSAEDCRVNLKGALVRPHDALGATPLPDPFQLVMSKTERGIAQHVAACLGYTSEDDYLDNLGEAINEVACMRSLPPWLRSHARTLCDAIALVREDAPRFVIPETSTFDDTIALATWLDQTFNDNPAAPPRKGPKDKSDEYDEQPGEGGDATGARWGEMRIENPPLTVRHPTATTVKTSPCTEGTRMRNWSRMATGEIYERRRKRPIRDTILVDQSGSMSWDANKLFEIVRQSPAGTVAGYDGSDGRGVLRILAKDGRMVAPELIEPRYGGNEVDGPALRWLASQRGRKVWVSDQGVCSDVCEDEEALRADCDKVIKGAGIKVCLTTDPQEIMKVLRGK